MSVMADAFVKAFIILTVLKPLGSHGIFRRRFLYFSLAVVLLLSIATFIVNFVQCNPPSELWRQVWRQGRALCWNPLIYEDLSTVRNSELPSFPVSISTQHRMQAWVLRSVSLSLWFHLRSSGICIMNGNSKLDYGSSYFLVWCEQVSISLIEVIHIDWCVSHSACVCGSIKTSDMNELSGVRPARFPNIYGRNIYSPNALGL